MTKKIGKTGIKARIITYLPYLIDIAAIALALWLVLSGYLILLLLGIMVYSIYVIWKGWSYIQMMMYMIDAMIYKYRKSKELKNGRTKDRPRS